MGEYQLQKEESLRIVSPVLYRRMIDIFKKYNIHPYDAHGFIKKSHSGFELSIKLADSFSEVGRTIISDKQAFEPDEEVSEFFKETAESCKNRLIQEYFKMIKL